jgi:hypothetical protein
MNDAGAIRSFLAPFSGGSVVPPMSLFLGAHMRTAVRTLSKEGLPIYLYRSTR